MARTEPRPRPRFSPALPWLRQRIGRPAALTWLARLLIVGLIGASLWIALDQFTPSVVVPADAPADVFSAERAMTQLEVIAQSPRPVGSDAHAAVEHYLIDQLTAMGLSPAVEATTGVASTDSGDVWAGDVRNIVARIPGTVSTRAILLAAHYDSVPTGPGAGDCGSCVVTVLETVRALQASAPLRNDVIVLFADSEEHDMLGAKTFMAEHPWARDVGVALNFEAIGTSGASMLSYVGPDSGELTGSVLSALPHPLTSSFMSSLGLGNDTVQYVSQGAAGYEFVIFGGVQAYHSALDNVPRIDEGSLQDNGSNLLAVTRRLGTMDLATIHSGEQVYFNAFRDTEVRYPASWAIPLALLSAVLLAGVLVLGFRRHRLAAGRVALGGIVFVTGVVGSAVLVTFAEWGLRKVNPNYQVFMGGSGYHDGWLVVTYAGLALLAMLALHAWTRGRIGAVNLAVGAMIWWALLLLATSVLFPAVSYVFTWPLLGATLALGLMLTTKDPAGGERITWQPAVAAMVALLPAILLLAPLVIWGHAVVSYVELPTRLPLAALPILFVSLGLGLGLPFLPLPEVKWRWALPTVALAGTVAAAVVAIALSGFSASQPRPDYVAYILDADSGQARWVSVGTRTDAWTAQFLRNGSQRTQFAPLPSELPDMTFAALEAPAPVVDLPLPQLALTGMTTNGVERTLRLHLSSPRHAPNVQIVIESDTAITQLSIGGKPAGLGNAAAPRTTLTLQYYGLPADGTDLAITTEGQAPVRIALEERSNGLPSVPGMTIQPRPDSTMPAPFENADPTIVRKTFTF